MALNRGDVVDSNNDDIATVKTSKKRSPTATNPDYAAPHQARDPIRTPSTDDRAAASNDDYVETVAVVAKAASAKDANGKNKHVRKRCEGSAI